jgi:hypothetical protein
MRTPEGMAIAKAKGKLEGKQPKLSAPADRLKIHPRCDHDCGQFSVPLPEPRQWRDAR